MERDDLRTQLRQRWDRRKVHAKQVVITGHDLPYRVQALHNRSPIRSELPWPANQRLNINMQDLRHIEQHGQPIHRADATLTCDNHDSDRPTRPASAA
jgi:uncharacterized NAD(P)/FAD-binding protein YdhS